MCISNYLVVTFHCLFFMSFFPSEQFKVHKFCKKNKFPSNTNFFQRIFSFFSSIKIYSLWLPCKRRRIISSRLIIGNCSQVFAMAISLLFQFMVYIRCRHLITKRPQALQRHLYFMQQKKLPIKRQQAPHYFAFFF